MVLAALLALAGAARAQSDPDAGEDAEAGREAREGPIQFRERYFESRRSKPGDASFDTARARLAALIQMEAQIAAAGQPPRFSTQAWASIGPEPINLGQTPGYVSDVSGRVTSLAIDAIDGAVYIGGAQGGVWKTTNDGNTWSPIGDTLGSLAIGAIAVDPAAHAPGQGTIYVGTGEANGSCDSYGGVGIFKSVDSGASWSGPLGNAQLGNRSIGSIAIDRADSSHLFAASTRGYFGADCVPGTTLPNRGIYESSDGGNTWTHRTLGNTSASVVMQDPFTPTTWWGALNYSPADTGTQNGGLVKSTNNGTTWIQQVGVAAGLPAIVVSTNPENDWSRAWITGTVDNPTTPTQSILYVGNGLNLGSVYKSTGGTSWSQLGGGALAYCSGQCWYDLPLLVEPGNPSIFYTGGGPSYSSPYFFQRSNDGGSTFSSKIISADAGTSLHPDMHAIATWPGQPNRLWVGNDGGVWRSNDRGDHWVDLNEGLPLTQFTACDLDPTGAKRVYAGSQDNGTEGWMGSSSWMMLDGGDGGYALIDPVHPSNLVHTYFNRTGGPIEVAFTTGGFSTTSGHYVVSAAPGNGIPIQNADQTFERVLFYAPIHLDHGATTTLYFGTNHLWRAPNFFANGGHGNEFSMVGVPADDLTGGNGAVSAIETFASPTPGANADVIYTGSDTGHVFRVTNATNASPTWAEVDVGASALFVSDIVIDPSNASVVYASRAGFSGSAGQNVRKSIDGGASWSPAANGIPDIPVNALALDPLFANRIWAGTDIGVYVSSDAGANWAPFSSGLPRVAVFDLKARSSTKELVACTHGRGAFLLSLDPSLIFSDDFESKNTAAWSSTAGGS